MDGITLDGEEVTSFAQNESNLIFVVGETDYTVTLSDNGHAIIVGGEFGEGAEVAPCTWIDFIGEYFYAGNSLSITVNITAFGVTVTTEPGEVLVGTITDAAYYLVYIEYDYADYLFNITFEVDEKEYMLQQYDVGDYDQLGYLPFGEEEGYLVQRDKKQILEDWSEFYGTFGNDTYTVTLDETGITITNGETVKLNAQQFEFFSDYDYEYGVYYYQFQFTYDGKTCLIQPDELGRYIYFVVDAASENAQSLLLIAADYELDWSEFVGNYSASYDGSDGQPYELLFEITEDAFYITVNGGARTAVTVEWFEVGDYGPQFTLIYNGKTYYWIFYVDFEYGSFSNEDESIYADVYLVLDYNDFYSGEFTSADGKYKVVVSEQGLSVTLDGATAQNANDLDFYVARNERYTFSFTVGDKSYVLQQWGINYDKLVLLDYAGTIQVTLFCEGYTFDVEEFVGTFQADGNVYYKVQVNSDGSVILTVGEQTYTATNVDVTTWNSFDYEILDYVEYNELSFTANGENYYFQFDGESAYLYNDAYLYQEAEGAIDITLQKV